VDFLSSNLIFLNSIVDTISLGLSTSTYYLLVSKQIPFDAPVVPGFVEFCKFSLLQ